MLQNVFYGKKTAKGFEKYCVYCEVPVGQCPTMQVHHENGTHIESLHNVVITGKALCTDGKVRTFHITEKRSGNGSTCWNATVKAYGKRVSGFVYLDGTSLCKENHTVRFDQWINKKNSRAIPHYMDYCSCKNCNGIRYAAEVSRKACNREA